MAAAPIYYKNLFCNDGLLNVFPKILIKKRLTSMASIWMSREFSAEEIHTAVFQCSPDKAPGPDGFSVSFFQHHWEHIGKEVTTAILHFFETGELLSSINHTSLTLIPKVLQPTDLRDYRPISCCNSLYKFISKALTNRLQEVIGHLVSPNQSAFIKRRSISDNILLAHELVRNFNKKVGKDAV